MGEWSTVSPILSLLPCADWWILTHIQELAAREAGRCSAQLSSLCRSGRVRRKSPGEGPHANVSSASTKNMAVVLTSPRDGAPGSGSPQPRRPPDAPGRLPPTKGHCTCYIPPLLMSLPSLLHASSQLLSAKKCYFLARCGGSCLNPSNSGD